MRLTSFDTIAERFSTIITDLDGTLIDSMFVWNKVDIDFLTENGIKFTNDYTDAVKSMSFREAADYTIARYSLNKSPEEVMDRWNEMVRQAYRHDIKLKPGVYEFLSKVKAAGITIVAATALSYEAASDVLTNNSVIDFFSGIATLSQLGSDANKRSPDIYRFAAQLAGEDVSSRCLVFEDIYPAVVSASNDGFAVCAVYDEAGSSEWEKLCEVANFTIVDWHDII